MLYTLYLLAMFAVALLVTLAFKSLVARHIINDMLRITAIGLCFFATLVGWNLWALSDTATYPPSIQPMNGNYYFTLRSYSLREAGLKSFAGNELTFYQHRFWWFDKKLGFLRLDGVDMLGLDSKIQSEGPNSYQLTIKSSGVVVVDTVLNEGQLFNFQRRVTSL